MDMQHQFTQIQQLIHPLAKEQQELYWKDSNVANINRMKDLLFRLAGLLPFGILILITGLSYQITATKIDLLVVALLLSTLVTISYAGIILVQKKERQLEQGLVALFSALFLCSIAWICWRGNLIFGLSTYLFSVLGVSALFSVKSRWLPFIYLPSLFLLFQIPFQNAAIHSQEAQTSFFTGIVAVNLMGWAFSRITLHARMRNFRLTQRIYKENSELNSTLAETSQLLKAQEKTTQKQAKALDKQSNQIAELNERVLEYDKLKTEFLANISHEMRTPLNSIIGFSEIITPNSRPDDIRQSMRLINQNGQQLLGSLENMIEMAKITSGSVRVKPELLDPHDLLNTVHSRAIACKLETGKNDVEIVLNTPSPNIKSKLSNDKNHILNVFDHLISNALKFTNKGSIEIGYSLIPSREILFFVKDTGRGIKQDKADQIFSLFHQDSHTYLHPGEIGTGLGLSISRGLVDLMGGRIGVNSKAGKGSFFHFILPLASPMPTAPKKFHDKPVIVSKSGQKELVLIVEDTESNYKYLNTLVRRMNLDTLWARDGNEAIEMAKNNPEISLVLMDIQLPTMSGLEATKKIRAFAPDLPIIAQTAYAMSGDREVSLEAGCDDYIPKPIRKKDLEQLIDNYILKSLDEKKLPLHSWVQ